METIELASVEDAEAILRLQQRRGYSITRTQPLSTHITLVFLSKPAPCPVRSVAAGAGQSGVSGPEEGL